jgi:hypothetical protein
VYLFILLNKFWRIVCFHFNQTIGVRSAVVAFFDRFLAMEILENSKQSLQRLASNDAPDSLPADPALAQLIIQVWRI